MSAHLRTVDNTDASSGAVDGKAVPIPHFGVVLTMDDWKALAGRLEAAGDIDWLHKPMKGCSPDCTHYCYTPKLWAALLDGLYRRMVNGAPIAAGAGPPT